MTNNYRAKVTYEGKIMAGARALWKATGVKDRILASRLLLLPTPLRSLFQDMFICMILVS